MALNTSITIRLRDEFSKGLGKMKGAASKFGAELKKGLDFSATMNQAAENMERFSAGARSLAGVPIRAAVDYEHAMTGLSAMAGASADEMKRLRDLSMSLDNMAPTAAVDAMTAMAQDGAKAADIMENFGTVLNLAVAAKGVDRFAEVSDKIGNIAAGFGITDLARAGDVMTATFTDSATDFFELSEAMVQAGPAATKTGQSFEFANAALKALATGGIKGAMAGTALRQALVKLAPTSKRAREAMEELGLEVFDSDGNFRNGIDIFEDLARLTGDMSEGESVALIKNLFGEEAFVGVSALIDAARDGSFRETIDGYDEANGAAKEFADKMKDDTAGAIREAEAQFEKLKIQIGTEMLPTVIELLESIKPLVEEIGEFAKENPELIRTLGSTVIKVAALSAVLAPLIRTAGALKVGFHGLKAVMGAAGLTKSANDAASSLGGLNSKLGKGVGLAGAAAFAAYAVADLWSTLKELHGLQANEKDLDTAKKRNRATLANVAHDEIRRLGMTDDVKTAINFKAGDDLTKREGMYAALGKRIQDAQANGGNVEDVIRGRISGLLEKAKQAEGGEVDVTVRVEAGNGTSATVTRTRSKGAAKVNAGSQPVGAF